MGAIVMEVNIPELSMATFAGYVVMIVEASSYHYDMLRENPEGFGADVRALFEAGTAMKNVDYIRAQQARRKITKAIKRTFKTVDILAAPTLPTTVPQFDRNWVKQNIELTNLCMPFAAPSNVTGTPSLSVPIGFSVDGLPVGMQLMGDHLCEELLFQVGSNWETAYKGSSTYKEYVLDCS